MTDRLTNRQEDMRAHREVALPIIIYCISFIQSFLVHQLFLSLYHYRISNLNAEENDVDMKKRNILSFWLRYFLPKKSC